MAENMIMSEETSPVISFHLAYLICLLSVLSLVCQPAYSSGLFHLLSPANTRFLCNINNIWFITRAFSICHTIGHGIASKSVIQNRCSLK